MSAINNKTGVQRAAALRVIIRAHKRWDILFGLFRGWLQWRLAF